MTAAATKGTQRPQNAQRNPEFLRTLRSLRSLLLLAVLGTGLSAHDLEHTQVTIAFARDGSFVADVANDPDWLKLRQASIPGPFADRVVLWVDGREIRPASVEFINGTPAVNRLRGRLPLDARTLRWYYGLVIDPYPLTIRRADGRIIVEEIGGNAWSRTIDLSGQFRGQAIGGRMAGVVIAFLLLMPVALRFRSQLKDTKATKAAKERTAPR